MSYTFGSLIKSKNSLIKNRKKQIKTDMIKLTIWLFDRTELKIEIEIKLQLSKSKPIYDVIVLPISINAVSSFNEWIPIKYITVGIILKTEIIKQPINFPRTNSIFFIGFENRISIVPVFSSLLKLFMQIAGNRKINIIGDREKKVFKSAKPAFNKLNWLSNTHVNRVAVVRKTVIIV